MRKWAFILFLEAGLIFGWSSPEALFSNARTIPWSAVPEAVQLGLKSQSGVAYIVGVQQGFIEGSVVYRGVVDRDGISVAFYLSEDGSLFTPTRNIAWNEVPRAVQETFVTLESLDTLQKIEERGVGGQRVYEFVTNQGGQVNLLQIAESGEILEIFAAPSFVVGSTPVLADQIPVAVQESLSRLTGYGELTGISGGVVNGRVMYDATFVEPRSRTHVRVAANGNVLGSSTVLTEAAGAQFSRERFVNFGEIPYAAQLTINTLVGAQPVQTIKRTLVNGAVCYEVRYFLSGRPVEMCVSEQGKVVR